VKSATEHRLEGFEHDSLLAFLALLGLLRSLEAIDLQRAEPAKLRPRAYWDFRSPPVRPVLRIATELSAESVASTVADGLQLLARAHDFGGRRGLDFQVAEARSLALSERNNASATERRRADLVASLFNDAATKSQGKQELVEPTPLCLLFGQGHQYFLERLTIVPAMTTPVERTRRRRQGTASASECLAEALFEAWHRSDGTPSFRWDPPEDVRYALIAGDPTDDYYKGGTQHGANRLAAIGLAELPVCPQRRSTRVRALIPGGEMVRGEFSFAWPLWREPATLAAIRAMLSHPKLRIPGALDHLGVEYVFVAKRVANGKFLNFSRGRALVADPLQERTLSSSSA
jgi:hypothetical protein